MTITRAELARTDPTTIGLLDFDSCYRAVRARDNRFDGQFFVAVATTGIYCRPSCPAITPKPQNVDFVLTAAAAQQAGYRACRRCLPDAVPGSPRWNLSDDLAARAMRLITDGVVDRDGVDGLASRLGYSGRHLTRILTAQLGAGPLALSRAQRATNARILIQRTTMPMSDVAFASGFRSIRQFNDTIREVFAMNPSDLRRTRAAAAHGASDAGVGSVTVNLPVRQPFTPRWLEWFLAAHVIDGVEEFDGTSYRRSLDLPHGPAVVELTLSSTQITATFSRLDLRDMGTAVNRVRRLLDLDADVAAADEVLAATPALAESVAALPGIRVPGSVGSTELLLRVMIGQQISLKAARTHGARLVGALGEPLAEPSGAVTHVFPTAVAVADRGAEVLTGPRRRVDSIIATARTIADGGLAIHPGMRRDDLRSALLTLPGVGPWTADYVTMRTLGDPDILLDTDLVIRRSADAAGLDLRHTDHWSPWRSYASMHLWHRHLHTSEPMLSPDERTSR
ncbi:DNA-3-methyladenine glycosylase 2 family protein [Williamsia sterculiae]|uniref:DNA-3-methyladenine glycosylase II n=1 Tax=Williamsia sterculiae TaxID=1344003 RepID=A0A1N7FU29_9NOCA|nr:AlkA N-terminal domain-containing protein [Williamsia sterculiae]SIS03848.1 DNA-3-methyladenine glycosylase II [Williamsia sterculiae]